MLPLNQFTAKARQDEDGTLEQLLSYYRGLGEADRRSLLDFAQFLCERSGHGDTEGEDQHATPSEPLPILRPAEESVVKAIQRLGETYPMLDKGTLLNETATLMAEHVLQGRSARAVIDDLEALFARHYQDWR